MNRPSTITSAFIFSVKVKRNNEFVDTLVIAYEIADIIYHMKDITEIKKLDNIRVYGTLLGRNVDIWKSSNGDYIAFAEKWNINPSPNPDESVLLMVVESNVATVYPRQYDWNHD
jgi:hypothetical protein